jgi:polyribonucleotide nucleotidyltransferase
MSKPELYRFVAKLGHDELIFETGQLADQADGAIVIRSGDSMLLATAVSPAVFLDAKGGPAKMLF